MSEVYPALFILRTIISFARGILMECRNEMKTETGFSYGEELKQNNHDFYKKQIIILKVKVFV